MDGYSAFFTFNELTDSDSNKAFVANNRIDAKKYELAGRRLSNLLETIRHILGDQPIKVSSGFRNPLLNKAIGSRQDGNNGRKLSTHCKFEAADIIPQMNTNDAFTALMKAHKDGLLSDLRKVIREDHKGILHIEVKMNVHETTMFFTTSDNIKFKRV
jgi:hypothetical protein